MESTLKDLIAQLVAQSGPRGATFGGRIIPQGQTPNLTALMAQMPVDIPEQGYGMLPSMNPAMLMRVSGGMTGGQADLIEGLKNLMLMDTKAAQYYEEQKRR